MKTSQLTRRMMLPALFLGLAGFAQAGQNQTQRHAGGHVRQLRVFASASKARGWISVRTSVREIRSYPRLPALKLSQRRRTAIARHRDGKYQYIVIGKLSRSRVHVAVRKYHGHRLIGQGSTVARVRGQRPDRKPTYVVSRYHPLTGKHIHTQRFDDRAAALKWFEHNKRLWWLFVYSNFGKKPNREYRGTQAVCKKSALAYNANLLDGKRAKAMAPRIKFQTVYQ